MARHYGVMLDKRWWQRHMKMGTIAFITGLVPYIKIDEAKRVIDIAKEQGCEGSKTGYLVSKSGKLKTK